MASKWKCGFTESGKCEIGEVGDGFCEDNDEGGVRMSVSIEEEDKENAGGELLVRNSSGVRGDEGDGILA